MANRVALLSLSLRKQIDSLSNFVRHPVLVNSLALLMMRGATTGARLLVLFFIARVATPSQFGIVAFTLSIVEIARTVADFGIDLFAIREFSITKQVELIESFASLLSFAKLICGSVAYLVIIVIFLFQKDYTQSYMAAVMGLLIVTALWSNLSIVYFQARLKVSAIIAPILLINVLTVIAVATLVWFKASLLLIVALLPLTEAINAAILLHKLQKELPLTRVNWKWESLAKLLWKSSPLAITAVLVTLYTRMDVVMVNSFLGTEAVGYYGIAFRITEPFQLVAVSLATSIYSHISTTLITNRHRIRYVISRYLLAVFLYGLVTCLLLAVIAPYAIQLLLPRYVPAIAILRILAIALVFRTINTSLTSLIQAYGHFVQITGVATWNLIIISIALFILVPRLGVSGAALALLTGEIANTLIQSWLLKRAMTTNSMMSTTAEI